MRNQVRTNKASPGLRLRRTAMLLLAATTLSTATIARAQTNVPTPAEYFGFELGSDGNYASWDQEIAYFKMLDKASDRIQLREIGKSTLGKPFLVMTISSPENLAKSKRLQEISRKLTDPRGLSPEQIKAMVGEGKVVVLATLGQHSTEVASSQVAPLLVHEFATSNDPTIKTILENAVIVLIPSFNPDGFVMVKDWTAKTAGTPYQGVSTPDLYHHYAGHDNNRDAFMLNLKESKLWAQVAYHEWFPQIYNDTHQMGAYSARLFVPPKTDPILPDVDPIVWRQMMLLGAGMATKLDAAGVKGVETQVGSYTGWQMPTFHGMTPSRNIVGFHTESASARLIWPIEIKPEELPGSDRGRPSNEAQMSYPNPWKGGTWRMGDIVRQQKIALLATFETAARQREMFLSNMALMGQRQVERGQTEAPYAHVVPASQIDSGTAAKMIATLMEATIEVTKATKPLNLGGVAVQPGDYVIRSDQPMRGYVHSLLVPYAYPDNPWTRNADGTPLRPKDFASTNLGELMGVKVAPVTTPLGADLGLELLSAPPKPAGGITGSGSAGWLLTPEWNDSYPAVTQILKAGGPVYRLTAASGSAVPGTFWIPAGGAVNSAMIKKLAAEYGLPFEAAPTAPTGGTYALKPLKVGLYRRYRGGNADEGWTRWIFDNWKFPYTRIDGADVQAGNLAAKFDVVIMPDDSMRAMMGEAGTTPYPAEYDKVLGDTGVEALKAFANAGGTLVFFSGATDLAIEKFGIPVKNAVAGLSMKDFYVPGSMLRVKYDTSEPLAYGMPAEGLVLFDSAPVFEVAPGATTVDVAASYPEGKLMSSGWLNGESHLTGKSALLDIGYGKGRLVLIGFQPQNRAETHGTFKILFNAMYLNGSASPSGN